MRHLNAIVALSLLSIPLCAHGEPPEESAIVQSLRQAGSEAELDAVINKFVESNVKLINDLVNLLRTSSNPEVQGRACYLLGEVDSGHSMRPLIEYMLVKVSVPMEQTRKRLWGPYPCQDALVKIGGASRYYLVELLGGAEGEEKKAGALRVLQHIYGRRGAVAVLEESWEKAGFEERKELEKALDEARRWAR
jgi:hypothetical protein